jgi:hypothetical protein
MVHRRRAAGYMLGTPAMAAAGLAAARVNKIS